jgi:hypothetical protein
MGLGDIFVAVGSITFLPSTTAPVWGNTAPLWVQFAVPCLPSNPAPVEGNTAPVEGKFAVFRRRCVFAVE